MATVCIPSEDEEEDVTIDIINEATVDNVTDVADRFQPPVPLTKCKTLNMMKERLRCAYNQYHGLSMDTDTVLQYNI